MFGRCMFPCNSALDLDIDSDLDKLEFTVMILLRVGAMTPSFVTVIVDWYQGEEVTSVMLCCDGLESLYHAASS